MTDDPGQLQIQEDQDDQKDQDDPGQLQAQEDQGDPVTTDANEQAVSLSTEQAGQQIGVDSRTVRRWITAGIRTPGGALLKLQARQVRVGRTLEWRIYQPDLDEFLSLRDRAATEGQAAGEMVTRAEESQALTTTVQIISAELERRTRELERRDLALSEAQATIERLSFEAGRQAGRNEELERELAQMRERVNQLEQERDQWQRQAQDTKTPRRIRLLPWQKEKE